MPNSLGSCTMSRDVLDIDSYLARIGYDGPVGAPPTLETLGRIQMCHACSIPFENIDVLLGKQIKLEMADVQQKLIVDKRGGYCFEQNGLMLSVLETLEYEVVGLSGRVRVGRERDFTPPRTHLFAKVMLDGVPWLVDVGVGGMTPTRPLRMDIDEPQETLHDTRRIIQGEDSNGLARWFHQVLIGDDWQDVCEFSGEWMPEMDRGIGNWWTSTNPESKFRQNIMGAMAIADGSRHSLSTNQYVRRSAGVVLEKIDIATSEQMIRVLADRFGIELPADTVFGIEGL